MHDFVLASSRGMMLGAVAVMLMATHGRVMGVCGLPRLSNRSMIATGTFMLTGFITVFIARHLLGSQTCHCYGRCCAGDIYRFQGCAEASRADILKPVFSTDAS